MESGEYLEVGWETECKIAFMMRLNHEKRNSLSLSPVILRKKEYKENIKRTIKLKFFLFQSNTKTVVAEINR